MFVLKSRLVFFRKIHVVPHRDCFLNSLFLIFFLVDEYLCDLMAFGVSMQPTWDDMDLNYMPNER